MKKKILGKSDPVQSDPDFRMLVHHYQLLSARTAMCSMPVVLTEWEKENDSQNQ